MLILVFAGGCPADDVVPVAEDTGTDTAGTESESESETDTESESESSTESESESESSTESESESSTESESESESESSTESESESESESSTETGTETDTETESSTETETESSTETETESSTETETDTESETGLPPNCDPNCGVDCILHVDDDAPPDGDGTSWASAFQTVQEAMDCSAPDQQIWVAGGDYPGEGSDSVAVQPSHALELYGGFAGTETSLDERVLGLHESTLGPAQDSIVVINDDLLVDGFSLRGGSATLGGAVRVHSPGFFTADVEIRNSLLEDNTASNGGALGIATQAVTVRVVDSELRNNFAGGNGSVGYASDARFSFEGCDVHDNPGLTIVAAFNGGFDYAQASATDTTFSNNSGVSMASKWVVATNCTFEDNLDSGLRGQQVTAVDCRFINNHSDKPGGAVAAGGGLIEDGLRLRDCLFIGNSSELDGGAVSAGDLEIERTRFIANTAVGDGGAIEDLSAFGSPSYVRDSEFIDNVAGDQGGGIYGSPEIIRSSFTGNLAAGEPNGLDSGNNTQFATVTASVFWPDTVRNSAPFPDDFPVVTTDSCIPASPDNFVDLQGNSVELVGSPFAPADLDDDGFIELYLDLASPCVDLAAVPPPPELNELDWSTATTQASQCTDSGLLDAGMHYTPLSAVGACP